MNRARYPFFTLGFYALFCLGTALLSYRQLDSLSLPSNEYYTIPAIVLLFAIIPFISLQWARRTYLVLGTITLLWCLLPLIQIALYFETINQMALRPLKIYWPILQSAILGYGSLYLPSVKNWELQSGNSSRLFPTWLTTKTLSLAFAIYLLVAWLSLRPASDYASQLENICGRASIGSIANGELPIVLSKLPPPNDQEIAAVFKAQIYDSGFQSECKEMWVKQIGINKINQVAQDLAFKDDYYSQAWDDYLKRNQAAPSFLQLLLQGKAENSSAIVTYFSNNAAEGMWHETPEWQEIKRLMMEKWLDSDFYFSVVWNFLRRPESYQNPELESQRGKMTQKISIVRQTLRGLSNQAELEHWLNIIHFFYIIIPQSTEGKPIKIFDNILQSADQWSFATTRFFFMNLLEDYRLSSAWSRDLLEQWFSQGRSRQADIKVQAKNSYRYFLQRLNHYELGGKNWKSLSSEDHFAALSTMAHWALMTPQEGKDSAALLGSLESYAQTLDYVEHEASRPAKALADRVENNPGFCASASELVKAYPKVFGALQSTCQTPKLCWCLKSND